MTLEELMMGRTTPLTEAEENELIEQETKFKTTGILLTEAADKLREVGIVCATHRFSGIAATALKYTHRMAQEGAHMQKTAEQSENYRSQLKAYIAQKVEAAAAEVAERQLRGKLMVDGDQELKQ